MVEGWWTSYYIHCITIIILDVQAQSGRSGPGPESRGLNAGAWTSYIRNFKCQKNGRVSYVMLSHHFQISF